MSAVSRNRSRMSGSRSRAGEVTFTEEEKAVFQDQFQLFDKDGSGEIPLARLGTIIRSLGMAPTEREVQAFVADNDVNGNGKMDFSEFLTFLSRWMKPEEEPDELKNAFQFFDPKNTGYIDADQLRHMMANMGEKLTEEEAVEMINIADTEKKGRIKYEDFAALLTQGF